MTNPDRFTKQSILSGDGKRSSAIKTSERRRLFLLSQQHAAMPGLGSQCARFTRPHFAGGCKQTAPQGPEEGHPQLRRADHWLRLMFTQASLWLIRRFKGWLVCVSHLLPKAHLCRSSKPMLQVQCLARKKASIRL